ncbi:MAG: hypothetical protein QNJ00_04385 [Woeseiaceae bacterium]|nr:hypothetical protein [Woeseiaceae bacterium]
MARKLSELYAVTEASFTEHGDEVLRLWTLFDNDETPDQEKIDWLYLDNPEGQGAAFGLWHRPESHLAGIMCFSRRALHFGETTFEGCLIADLIIERRHRALGPFRLISEHAVKRALEQFEVMYSFPIVTTRTPGLGDIVERDIDYVDAVLPLKLSHYLKRRLPAPLAAVGGLLLGPLSRLPLSSAYRRLRRRYSQANVDSAFIDALWERVHNAGRLQGTRRADNVLWRLEQPPFRDHALLGLMDNDGQPAAMVAYQVGDDSIARVIDICWFDLEAAEAALVMLARELMVAGAVSVTVKHATCYAEFGSLLDHLGFRERRSRTLRIIARPEHADVANANAIWIQPLDNDYV